MVRTTFYERLYAPESIVGPGLGSINDACGVMEYAPVRRTACGDASEAATFLQDRAAQKPSQGSVVRSGPTRIRLTG
jgi:hypothetical protein